MNIAASVALANLLVVPLLANAATCPVTQDLVRTQGEYSWFSNTPGWEGGFAAPMPGRGLSTSITHFLEASWVQLNNHANSLGYIVCSYRGNYDNEIIRFTQTATRHAQHVTQLTAQKPTQASWNCNIMPDYPSTACVCSADISSCSFATE